MLGTCLRIPLAASVLMCTHLVGQEEGERLLLPVKLTGDLKELFLLRFVRADPNWFLSEIHLGISVLFHVSYLPCLFIKRRT